MAYDEVGGCRLYSGFFHGECPIQETGRQSYANKGKKVCAYLGIAMLFFCLCKANFLQAQNRIAVFGFYLWNGMKHPATCKEFCLSFPSPYRVIHRQ